MTPGDSRWAHMHRHEDEMIFVHRGRLDVALGASIYPAAAGATVFILHGTWIGFRAAGSDTAGFFVVFNTPAFEKCLRALSVRPGERYAPLAPAAMARVSHECDWATKAH